MESTEAYFLFVDANRIHYCKVRLLCLYLKRKKNYLALEVDTGLNIPYTTELRRHEGELCDTMYLKSNINIKNFQINPACLLNYLANCQKTVISRGFYRFTQKKKNPFPRIGLTVHQLLKTNEID